MTIKFRNALETDVTSMVKLTQGLVEELHQKFDKKRFMSMINRVLNDPVQKKGIFIAEDDASQKAVGMIIGIVKPAKSGKKEGFLQNVAVSQDARGQGIGKELVHRAIEYLKTLKTAEIGVNIRDSQKQAITMYERLGFVRSGNTMHLKLAS
nr:GNAT family N-acetyltransferase [Candidatus Sigynarchaeota archaeon]